MKPFASQNPAPHFSPLLLAGALEGRLRSWEQKAALEHLARCPECAYGLAETRRLLAANNALPPAAMLHPLEHLLAPLQRLIPMPVWAWHALIHGLTPFLWLLLVDPSALPNLQSPFWTLIIWPATMLMTTYFLWQQSWFRRFGQQLWEAGAHTEDAETLLHDHLEPLQGWRFGGGRLFFVLATLVTALNTILIPSTRWQAAAVVAVTGFYGLTVTIAMYWSWGWNAWWWLGALRFSKQNPVPTEMLFHARRQALEALLVASIAMIWHLIIALQMEGVHRALRVYAGVITLLLLSLWMGYVLLEKEVTQQQHRPFLTLRPLLRLSGSLALALLPLFITV